MVCYEMRGTNLNALIQRPRPCEDATTIAMQATNPEEDEEEEGKCATAMQLLQIIK